VAYAAETPISMNKMSCAIFWQRFTFVEYHGFYSAAIGGRDPKENDWLIVPCAYRRAHNRYTYEQRQAYFL